MFLDRKHTWQLAIMWVRSNPVLIRHISSKYYPFIFCSKEDLEAEAQLTAFLVIERLLLLNMSLSLTTGHFHRAFMKRCLQLAKGVSVVPCDIECLNIVHEVHESPTFDHQVVKEALATLTRRQRSVAIWTLEQPTPVPTSKIARHFNLTVRGVRKIINTTVKRLDCCGTTRICKTVKIVA